MSELSITIPGKPVAKMRPRFARRGQFVSVYNPQETEEGKIRWAIMSQYLDLDPIPAGTPIFLNATFYMPIPSGMPKKKLAATEFKHVKKPDLDNLCKTLKDCANGILWVDDSQVFSLMAHKFYSENPRTEMTITWEAL